MWRRTALNAAVLVSIVAAASYYSLGVILRRTREGAGNPSFDLYEWAYPNMIHALRSLERGHGLWWNPFQNCGQPFFANIQNSLLYPAYALFLLLPTDEAYLALVIVNLTVAGVGAYLLCRHFGVSRSAALCGALTVELGGITLQLASWAPTLLAASTWIPMALFACERVIARPSWRAGLVLGGVLALQLLASFPQTSLLTYEIVGLRVLWEVATRRDRTALRALAPIVLAFVLAPFLVGAQLVPGLDVAANSLRGEPLTTAERFPPGMLTWEGFQTNVAERNAGPGNVFAAITAGLMLAGILAPGRRRIAAFYLLAGTLFLALGFDNFLFRFFDQIPILNTFRDRQRNLWLLAAPLAVLVSFGADLLTGERTRRIHPLAVPALLIGVAGYWSLSRSGLRPWEWGFVLAACAASLIAWRFRAAAWLTALLLPILVGASYGIVGRNPFLINLENVSVFHGRSDVFAFVKQRMTLQDRIDILGKHGDYSLMPKLATVFEIPTIRDYEPLTSMRYAELMIMLVRTHSPSGTLEKFQRLLAGLSPMKSRNEYTFFSNDLPSNRPLLNLLAVRYLIFDSSLGPPFERTAPQLDLLAEFGDVSVYENPQALPRALYVPKLVVVPNPRLILASLARRRHRPREVVVVEEPPADGFHGSSHRKDGTPARGSVEILSDRGEEIRLRSTADEDGFVVISDQYYPGWEATVNGVPTPIMRANFAFKTLRVPAGTSDILLRYRPKSLPLGAGLSLATMLIAGAIALLSRPRES